ncbi:MAG: hypothetical protein Q7R81_06265 [Candidatus Peregrinibacteria bacterium]|nr:hypothetical protein [Candidatus Peregrinibacteria bacterium]
MTSGSRRIRLLLLLALLLGLLWLLFDAWKGNQADEGNLARTASGAVLNWTVMLPDGWGVKEVSDESITIGLVNGEVTARSANDLLGDAVTIAKGPKEECPGKRRAEDVIPLSIGPSKTTFYRYADLVRTYKVVHWCRIQNEESAIFLTTTSVDQKVLADVEKILLPQLVPQSGE